MTTDLQAQPAQLPAGVDPAEYLPFWEFFKLFIEFNDIDMPVKDFHREICDAVEDAVLGVTEWEWILINMPPRTGKTKLLEALACWTWAYANDAQMIYTTYSSDLVERSMDYVGHTLRAQWYIDLFGDHLHSNRGDLKTTVEGGQMHGMGTGGSITGKGGGLKRPFGGFIAVDDPNKPEEALSPTVSEGTKRWLHTTLENRRNSDRWCPIICAGHRLGPTDLFGYIEKTYTTTLKKITVDAVIELPNGEWESRIPETRKASSLKAMTATRYGRYVLASQYRQKPVALGGNLIPIDCFKLFRWADVAGANWDDINITVDTAMKKGQENDYSAAHAWGKLGQNVYLLARIHGKWESPELLTRTAQFSVKIRAEFEGAPVRVKVEAKAAGIGLVQQMIALGIPAEEIERDIDKVRRVKTVLPYIETGCAWIPDPMEKGNEWVQDVLDECASFSETLNHANDDDVDCLVDGIQLHLGGGRGILDLYG